jgi:hypothetical protein
MERKNTILLTVIAVATLLVAVVGATFAYFVASGSVNSTSIVNVTTSTIDTVSGGSTPCELNVTGADMRQSDGTAEGVAKSATCTLDIVGTKDPNNSIATTCTYDITYTPRTPDAVIRSEANSSGVKELSLAGSAAVSPSGNGSLVTSNYAETDLYTLQSKTTIVNDATFTFTDTATAQWTFTVRMYNYNFNQNDLANKSFGGTLTIENVVCSSDVSSSTSLPEPEEETPSYWNNNFVTQNIPVGTLPDGAYGGVYESRELLASNYSDFSTRPMYIRSTPSVHQACLYYNTYEFCLSPGYWISGDSNGNLTKAKLQADMEDKLGTTASSCTAASYGSRCFFGSYYCGVGNTGAVYCSSNSYACNVLNDGTAKCYRP